MNEKELAIFMHDLAHSAQIQQRFSQDPSHNVVSNASAGAAAVTLTCIVNAYYVAKAARTVPHGQ